MGIAIVGTRAMGCLFSARLNNAGCSVTLIAQVRSQDAGAVHFSTTAPPCTTIWT
ncbi:2-dehydropantoate 2-reductase N-terminal domain-containing protein [Pseudomonas sp. R3-18-08]|uniref:2-dehydropantoate 2-reductase N-terminal domain-containing protein n=1 Tax=Pseudomonas sp. R3-18-08 TaxID=1173283 RepID=UPI00355932F0